MSRRRLWILAVALGGWAVARALGVFRVEVAGRSMIPTLRPGDWLVATRAGRIRRGRVVVPTHPDRGLDLVKRIADASGGRYLVVGDNPTESTDGRGFGPVGRESIEGVVRFRYWPRPAPVR